MSYFAQVRKNRRGIGVMSQLAFAPDETVLAVGGTVGIEEIDLSNGMVRHYALCPGGMLSDYYSDLRTLVYDSAMHYLAVWDFAGTVYLIERESGRIRSHHICEIEDYFEDDLSPLLWFSSDRTSLYCSVGENITKITVDNWNFEHVENIQRQVPVNNGSWDEIRFVSHSGNWIAEADSFTGRITVLHEEQVVLDLGVLSEADGCLVQVVPGLPNVDGICTEVLMFAGIADGQNSCMTATQWTLDGQACRIVAQDIDPFCSGAVPVDQNRWLLPGDAESLLLDEVPGLEALRQCSVLGASSNGTLIAGISWAYEGSEVLISTDVGEILHRFEAVSEDPIGITISEDGTWLAIGASRGVEFFHLGGSVPRSVCPEVQSDIVCSIVSHPDSRFLACSTGDSVFVFSTQQERITQRFAATGTQSACFNDQGLLVIINGMNLVLIDPETGNTLDTLDTSPWAWGQPGPASELDSIVRVAPDRFLLAATNGCFFEVAL